MRRFIASIAGRASTVKRAKAPFALALCLLSLLFLRWNLASAAFDDTGTGARAAALGGAYVALGDDTFSLMYNPASLARAKRPEIASEYSRFYPGLTDGSNL